MMNNNYIKILIKLQNIGQPIFEASFLLHEDIFNELSIFRYYIRHKYKIITLD